MVFITFFKLKQDKWYIYKSDEYINLSTFNINISEFTIKYNPIELEDIIYPDECDKYDVDKYVKKYMDIYGIDNVRGGTYNKLELTTEEKQFIQKELWTVTDIIPDVALPAQLEEELLIDTNDTNKLKFIKHYENKLLEINTQLKEFKGNNKREPYLNNEKTDIEFRLFMLKNI